MAGITLRDYIREIEKQIDGKRYDEAAAHCHHILQSFPKAVEVYRLLGKAFLENQRYGDAADIFQRVLSALPDDFVSHAGMSIIREDEGNLDEAIWHMERAFDIQPANSALQEELRRMYGRRDNVEPPKIRLTRTALARMYLKGELFPQAIAETRAALAESPDRLDLLALLTEIYARAGQKAEAADAAARLARKLPYCMVANRILYETLKGGDRDAEAQTYLQRLNQVEPYYAFISETYPSLESVPDSSIRVDKLEWKVGQTQAGKSSEPLWASSLGVSLGEAGSSGENQIPDWLGAQTGEESAPAISLQPDTNTGAGFSWDDNAGIENAAPAGNLGTGSESGEAIPDWLKDIGWTPASTDSHEAETGYRFEEQLGAEAVKGELASAGMGDAALSDAELASEMPEWLRELAPEQAESGPQADENVTPWLDNLFATAEEGQPEQKETEPAPDAGAFDEGIPDWMQAGMAAGAISAGAAGMSAEPQPEEQEPGESTETGEIPGWLLEASGAAEVFPVEAEVENVEIPDQTEVAGAAQEKGGEELPAWLLDSAGETSPAESSEPAAQEQGEGALPDWLFSAESTPAAADAASEAKEGELPAWLTEEEVWQSEPQAEAETPAEPAAADELPAWLFDAAPKSAEPEPAEAGAAGGDDLADWLLQNQEQPAGAEEAPAEAVSNEELPAWLFESDTATRLEADAEPVDEGFLSAETFSETPAQASPAEAAASEELPAWLFDAGEPAAEAAAETGEAEAPQAEEPAAEVEIPEWLRGLESQAAEPINREAFAADVPADTTETPEREETLPEWLFSEAGDEQHTAVAAEETSLDWLSPESAAPAEATPLDEIPDWLRTGALADAAGGAAAWPSEETTEPEAPQETPAESAGEALPDWLMSFGEAPSEEPGAGEAAFEEQPVEAEEAAAEPVSDTQPTKTAAPAAKPAAALPDLSEAFAWLAAMMTPIEPEPEKSGPALETTPAETQPETPAAELFEAEPAGIETPAAEEAFAEAAPPEEHAPEAPVLEAEEPTPAPAPSADEAFSFPLDGDDAFAWLESLAVKQGAQEALLLTPEERAEKPPEWVVQAAEEAEAAPEAAAEAGAGAHEEAAAEPETPEQPAVDELAGLTAFEEEAPPAGEEARISLPEAAWGEVYPAKPEAEEAPLPAQEPAWTAEEPPAEVEPAAPEAAAEAEPPVSWVGSEEPAVSLDEFQAMPTEKLNNIPPAPARGTASLAPVEEAPDLPDWLAGVESETVEEITEWRPPTVTRRRYDLNQASLVELERLPGIGFIMAQRIIDYRETFGPFRQVEDLLNVPEFGPYTLDSIRENLFVIPAVAAPRSEPVSARPATRRQAKKADAPIENPPSARPSTRAPAPEPALAPAPAAVVNPEDVSAPAPIQAARRLSTEEDWSAAQAAYNQLVQTGQHLDWVIGDLNAAVQTHPEDFDLWQNLGDAYLRANRLKEAMQAYSRAEKLLR